MYKKISLTINCTTFFIVQSLTLIGENKMNSIIKEILRLDKFNVDLPQFHAG